jgi:hypothetical protein
MDIEQKWNIPEESLKVAFDKLEIDNKFYPLFVERANRCVNDLAAEFAPEPPDKEDFDDSINIATEYMNIYVGQIDAGLSELWATTYANNRLNNEEDDSAWEAYWKVCKSQNREMADKDLALFARFLDDNPRFVENYIVIFINGGTIKDTYDFLKLYDLLIEKGKSEVYAREYALHHIDTPDDDYCHIFATKYEECINKGIERGKAYTIAEAYEDCYDRHYSQDNDLEGKKAIDVYIQGFEYAIVNGIDSPEKFAKAYQSAYYNNGEKPSYVAKGEYDDIIIKLLADKV